ncbi:pyridoxamine 5'-phosphate oxidase family protein [Methylobacter sp. G7]|uniref:pyridoxamine 5'-phosphate oxidase family protein n=1 Tax=Methylobacter sp. G7 TaxID=3230117 RepID=UPI003D804E12
MSEFFHEGNRQLQDRFETRRIADRQVDLIISDQISPEDKVFIEEQNMFFLATVDSAGRPNCSYKGGSVGLVKVVDEYTLAFPLYDGNGMYLSAGNVLVNPHVSLLFIDFQRQARLRLNGSAFILDNDPLMNHWPEAQLVLRVKLREMFPNCPRYIHKMTLVEESAFVPKQHCETPAPAWKRLEVVADVLPPRDAHLAGNEQDAAAALNRN